MNDARTPRRMRAIGALALATIGFLLYLPARDLGPVLDDAPLLADAAHIDHVGDLFGRGLFTGVRRYGGYYRPLTSWTYSLESALGLPIGARHLVNAALHGLTAAGAFLLLAMLLQQVAVPFAAALLFSFLPVHANAVVPVTGRGDLLAMLLVVGAWGAFRARRAGGGGVWLALSAGLFAAALLSKESAAVLPALLVAGEWVVSRGDPRELRRRPTDHLVLLAVLVAYGALRTAVLGGFLEPGLPDPLDNPLAGAGVTARIVGAPAAWLEAGRVLVWPWPLPPDYSGAALAPPGAAGWISLAGWALAIVLTVACLRAARRPGARFLGLSILLAGYLPVANLLFVAPVLFASRVLFLPSLGFALIVASLAIGEPTSSRTRRRVGSILLAGLALSWGITAFADGRRFASDVAFWGDAARLTPRNAKAWYNLGNARLRAGEAGAAVTAYERAVGEAPDLAIAWSNLGVARAAAGREQEAASAFARALSEDPGLAQAHAGLGSILLRTGEVAAGSRHLRISLALDPDQPDAEAIRGLLQRLEETEPEPE